MSRIEFKESDPRKRTFLTREQLRDRDIRVFGKTVQLSKKTLSKFFDVEVPDPRDTTFIAEGRPQRKMQQTINIADFATKTAQTTKQISETLDVLMNIVLLNRVLDPADVVRVGKSLTQLFTSAGALEDLPTAKLRSLKLLVDRIGIPNNPLDAGFDDPRLTSAQLRARQEEVYLYTYANFNKVVMGDITGVQDSLGRLSLRKPVYQVIMREDKAIIRPVPLNRLTAQSMTRNRETFNIRWLALVPQGLSISPAGQVMIMAPGIVGRRRPLIDPAIVPLLPVEAAEAEAEARRVRRPPRRTTKADRQLARLKERLRLRTDPRHPETLEPSLRELEAMRQQRRESQTKFFKRRSRLVGRILQRQPMF